MRESDKIEKILKYAREEAIRTGWNVITVEHFMLGVIRQEDNEACRFLTGHNLSLNRIKSAILDHVDKGFALPYNSTAEIRPSTELQHVNAAAASILQEPGTGHIPDTMVYMSVILKENSTITARIIKDMGLDFNLVYDTGKKDTGNGRYTSDDMGPETDFPDTDQPLSPAETLDRFGYDLTKAAEEGLLDPVIGRDKEIDRAISILCRRKKNNPLIVGEPGVGKTSVAEGIARRIAEKTVPLALLDRRVISLDMGSIVAGTRFRGDFEERLKDILDAVRSEPDIILFIDEIHNIVGTGGSGGAMDAADILKPALTKGEFQCIGATTSDEYRKIIEKDGALARRFQKVAVEQPSAETTKAILEGLGDYYGHFHNVVYSQEVIDACVALSTRYITDRNLPDKAIDVMDEAGAAVQIRRSMPPSGFHEMHNKLQELKRFKRACLEDSNFEMSARLLKMERAQEEDINTATDRMIHNATKNAAHVTVKDVMTAVSVMTGIPVSRMSQSEAARMKSLRSTLDKRIIGQDEAVDKVVRALLRNTAGLKDPGRPIGSFLFLGPTGVGKTHLAKTLAEQLFDSKDAIIRLDMSEYMEKISVSRLIGAPPGYVGYDDGGQLSERVRQKPYSVVLLDEIEKAHPDIFNILLQILDEGRLTDSNGRTVDFRNTVIIITSNIGSRDIRDFGRGLGYSTAETDRTQLRKSLIDKALSREFTPEFLNRLDETVYFNSLTRDDVAAILDLELAELHRKVNGAGYSLILTRKAKDFLCGKGYDPAYGARPLKRAIRRYLEDPLAETLLSGLKKEAVIKVDAAKDGESLAFSTSAPAAAIPVSGKCRKKQEAITIG
ncbi:MAG TPA: ATP-dependent Clp protease ATP-binding subunit [Candidatus Coprenecus stercoravium]|uniref:ATP-dependent Clp protease ATP-binding subunit n=1 Tax=Candidatus Coprenecus stercoravium TaxID=2840735 RepID=A0A9D2K8M4_9BACT|nr:ATP-dependent Clp protease ATP-binding subunit [Candidatus Coprenecus stercoravium]